MISCQRCKASLFLGTLFCPECGLMVDAEAASPTVSLPVDEAEEITTKPRQAQGPALLTRQDSIAVRVMGSAVAIPLRGQQDYILGRTEPSQAILPDIDLIAMVRTKKASHGFTPICATRAMRSWWSTWGAPTGLSSTALG
jgi:uncharacterized Zn finger protein (UPF0148 family)